MNIRTLTYDRENDLKLELYLPDVEKPTLFVYLHGGGLTAGNRFSCKEVFVKLAENGVAVASVDYRMYPHVKYPVFIEDSAHAVAFMVKESGYEFSRVFVGGSSAGGYLSMMLLFDPSYLGSYGLDPLSFDGWVLDAGQPTVHFNVLGERGLDTRLVRLDEAAPLYHIDHDFVPTREDGKLPMVLNIAASNDMTCRLEQLKLLNATLLHFGWKPDRLRFVYMNGFSHCRYHGSPVFYSMLESLLKG